MAKKITILIVPFFFILGGCSLSEQQRVTTIAINKCPVLKNYSREQLKRAASELRNLPNDSQLTSMLSDYSKLRDACRLAENKLKSMYKND